MFTAFYAMYLTNVMAKVRQLIQENSSILGRVFIYLDVEVIKGFGTGHVKKVSAGGRRNSYDFDSL